MCKACIILMLLCMLPLRAVSDVLEHALVRSGYVHSPLTSVSGISLEAEADAKPVQARRQLRGTWTAQGSRASLLPADTAVAVLRVNFDTQGVRATGPADDSDYALYGHAAATLGLDGLSLDEYNRLCLLIEPRCPGMRVVNINLRFSNRRAPDPGHNAPTGDHLIQLRNYAVNRCYLEIADLQRDCMDAITLSVSVNGRDLPGGPAAGDYIIHSVEAQRIACPEPVSGWAPAPGRIVYSQSGYIASGRKTAVCEPGVAGREFSIKRDDGTTVMRGRVGSRQTTIGNFGEVDFSSLTIPGRYRIEAGGMTSGEFAVGGSEVWEPSCWRVLNFIYCMRCGHAVSGVHSRCHTDLFCEHGGRLYSFAGGWHDAGDLSQQTLQTAEVSLALLSMYERRRDTSPLLAARLREEALWGLDFILRCRLGDGWHASSMGLLIWQDGIVGSHDDIRSVRKQNLPFDNYMYAAIEAYAARVLDDGTDPAMTAYLRRVAVEDYGYACRGFAERGFGGWISPYEHTYNTGESQFMATASWAASQLFALTGEEHYADDARAHMDYVLRCRQEQPLGAAGLCGFFYRTPEHRSTVHFIHQSREQIFMQALAELCRTQPECAECARWRGAIADYGNYLKALMRYTAPYGMLPAGVYRDDEPSDSAAFYAVHLFPPADAATRFRSQGEQGEHVAPGYFVKRFPIWFNIFNGNLAVHTSMGQAAAICARILDDDELRDIAREQLYWTVGKNPFAQSLIYGEGARYASLNNFSSGEIVGAMPVGIRSLGDSDEPYWPQINNACYKEVWLTSAGKWLALLAETD